MAGEIICPGCGGANPPENVCCGNPDCHKALGDFNYVLEEIQAKVSWTERLAERVATFVGRPHFVTVHIIWFTGWIVLNSGLIITGLVFDDYPYSLLGIILSIEAILLTSFLLISGNSEANHMNQRAELDYEVNVKSYRLLKELIRRLDTVENKLEQLKK